MPKSVPPSLMGVCQAILEEADRTGGRLRQVSRYEIDRLRRALKEQTGQAPTQPGRRSKRRRSAGPVCITLQVQQPGADAYAIGAVAPPASSPSLRDDQWAQRLDALWTQWRQEEPEPDADSEFVAWLCKKRGWTEIDSPLIHTFQV